MVRNWKRECIPRAIENVRTLWRKQYKDKASIVHQSAKSTEEPDEFDLWERDQSTFSQIGDEFDSFIDGNPVLLGERETSLSWWLEEVQRRTYPNLSQFAIDILSIPAMSAEPERVFSGCRRTISWQRMRLGVKVVEEGEVFAATQRETLFYVHYYVEEEHRFYMSFIQKIWNTDPADIRRCHDLLMNIFDYGLTIRQRRIKDALALLYSVRDH